MPIEAQFGLHVDQTVAAVRNQQVHFCRIAYGDKKNRLRVVEVASGKPRVIGSAENFPQHIALPRGRLEPPMALLKSNGIRCEIDDERHVGDRVAVSFMGTLRLDQEAAVTAMLSQRFRRALRADRVRQHVLVRRPSTPF